MEEIGDRLIQTLAKKLREAGGVCALPEMTPMVADSNPQSLLNRFRALDRIVREHNGHIHIRIAAEVAKSFAVQSPSMGTGLDGDVPRQFAQRVCEAIMENGFFAKAGTQLVAEGKFSSLQEFRKWQGRIERTMSPSIAKVADRLIERPDANGLRAPKRISKKKTTSEILRENLLLS